MLKVIHGKRDHVNEACLKQIPSDKTKLKNVVGSTRNKNKTQCIIYKQASF